MGRPSRHDQRVLPDYSEGVQIKTEDDDPRFNNALARGLAILRTFQLDAQLLGNAEIAEATGLSKPTVSRLTYTLMQLGYLRYRQELGKYQLAAGVVALAYPYLANLPVPVIARPLMEELAAQTHTNIGLGVREGFSVLYLEYALGEAQLDRRQRVGLRVPLIRTAMGRACVAAMEVSERDALYQELRQHFRREWTQLHADLEDAVEHFNQHGFVIAAGTFLRTTHSVAVPYLDADGHTLMVFNSQASAQVQTQPLLMSHGKRLLELTAEVKRRVLAQTSASSSGRKQ